MTLHTGASTAPKYGLKGRSKLFKGGVAKVLWQ